MSPEVFGGVAGGIGFLVLIIIIAIVVIFGPTCKRKETVPKVAFDNPFYDSGTGDRGVENPLYAANNLFVLSFFFDLSF